MKKIYKILLEILLFVCLAVLIFDKLSLIVTVYGKGLKNDRNGRLFYELPQDTLDIMFVGDSHIYNSFIPQKIYDETGYTSAIMATSAQTIVNSYWDITETLKKQDIKVIIMDAHSLEGSVLRKEDYLHYVSGVLAMPDLSLNKYKCFKEIKRSDYGELPSTLTLEDIVGFLQYRNDFIRDEGHISDMINLIFDPVKEFVTFGYFAATDIVKIDKVSKFDYKDEEFLLSETIVFEYFDKIIELCKNNNIKLIMTRAPYVSVYANEKTYESIFEHARKNNIDIIDYFDLLEEIEFNSETDFFDHAHVNYNGAKKLTSYLIRYLQTNCDLVNHKGDPKYNLWENNNYDYNILEEEIRKNISK